MFWLILRDFRSNLPCEEISPCCDIICRSLFRSWYGKKASSQFGAEFVVHVSDFSSVLKEKVQEEGRFAFAQLTFVV